MAIDPRLYAQPKIIVESPRSIPATPEAIKEYIERFWNWAAEDARATAVALAAVAARPMIAGVYVSADPTGVASTLGLSNVFPALGGGAAPVLGSIGGAGPAVAAQAGWIKAYNGVTAIFIPYWV